MDKQIPMSPVVPLEPDWQAMAIRMHDAYVRYLNTVNAVHDLTADGKDYWEAVNELTSASSDIGCWKDYPLLYGRLKAVEQYKRG